MKRTTRGFTLVELLVVIAIIALLMGLLLPALAGAMANARTRQDQSNVRRIHEAFLTYAGTNEGRLPSPAHVRRQAVDLDGDGGTYDEQFIPGLGDPNFTYNYTGPLYSCAIAQEYITPEIVISPVETNISVGQKGKIVEPSAGSEVPYDYAAYDPENNSYWDAGFSGDIRITNDAPCHTSYAHSALIGRRFKRFWKDSSGSNNMILSDRGTREGTSEGDDYKLSPTLRFHGADQQWKGVAVFGDGSATLLQSFFPQNVAYERSDQFGFKKDNIFAAEFDDAPTEQGSGDAWQVMSYFHIFNPSNPAAERILYDFDRLDE